MSVVEQVLEKVRAMPREAQQQVLDFAEYLAQRPEDRGPLRSVEGVLAPAGPGATEEVAAEARGE